MRKHCESQTYRILSNESLVMRLIEVEEFVFVSLYCFVQLVTKASKNVQLRPLSPYNSNWYKNLKIKAKKGGRVLLDD